MTYDERPLELSGAVFTPRARSSYHWRYRPTAVSLADGAGGGRQLSLLEVGTFALLSLTAQLAPRSGDLEQARELLAQRDQVPPGRVVLSAEPLTVEKVSLLVGDGQSSFIPVATSSSSGTPPYSAVFSLQLDPAQLTAVKYALSGERGWLAVAYEVRSQPAPTSTTTTEEQTTSIHVQSTTVTRSGTITTTVHQNEHFTPPSFETEGPDEPSGSPPDLANQAETIHTDAAVWASSL